MEIVADGLPLFGAQLAVDMIGLLSALRWLSTHRGAPNVDGAVLARARQRKTYTELVGPRALGRSLVGQSQESGGAPCVAEEGRTLLVVPVGIPQGVRFGPSVRCVPARLHVSDGVDGGVPRWDEVVHDMRHDLTL